MLGLLKDAVITIVKAPITLVSYIFRSNSTKPIDPMERDWKKYNKEIITETMKITHFQEYLDKLTKKDQLNFHDPNNEVLIDIKDKIQNRIKKIKEYRQELNDLEFKYHSKHKELLLQQYKIFLDLYAKTYLEINTIIESQKDQQGVYSLQNKYQELEERVAREREEHFKTEDKLTKQHEMEIIQLERTHQNEIKGLSVRNKELAIQISTQQDIITAEKKVSKQRESQYENTTDNYKAALADYSEEITQLKTKLTAETDKVTEYTTQLITQSVDIQSLQNALIKQKASDTDLEKRSQKLQDDLLKKDQRINAYEGEITTLQAQLQEQGHLYSKLQKELKDIKEDTLLADHIQNNVYKDLVLWNN